MGTLVNISVDGKIVELKDYAVLVLKCDTFKTEDGGELFRVLLRNEGIDARDGTPFLGKIEAYANKAFPVGATTITLRIKPGTDKLKFWATPIDVATTAVAATPPQTKKSA